MSKTKIIYIAGPMSGLPNYNHDAFLAAAERIRAQAAMLHQEYAVINPARNFGGYQEMTHAQYMRYSIHQLLIVDAVYMLTGWEKSKGAVCEHTIAQSLKLDIYYE